MKVFLGCLQLINFANFNLIKGILKDKNSEYEGDFNKEYYKEGKGKLKFNNGNIYEDNSFEIIY